MTGPVERRRFEMPLPMPWRPILLVFWGVRRGRAQLDLDGERLHAQYGWWGLTTTLDNVLGWEISGPWRWWTAIGLRSHPPFRDFSFDTTDTAGITLTFRDPVRFGRVFRAASLTVTVNELFALGRILEGRGIPGRDLRADDYTGDSADRTGR